MFDLLGLFLVIGAASLHLLGLDDQQLYFLLPVHQLFQRVSHDLFHIVQVLAQHDYLIVRSLVVELLLKNTLPFSPKLSSGTVAVQMPPTDSVAPKSMFVETVSK